MRRWKPCSCTLPTSGMGRWEKTLRRGSEHVHIRFDPSDKFYMCVLCSRVFRKENERRHLFNPTTGTKTGHCRLLEKTLAVLIDASQPGIVCRYCVSRLETVQNKLCKLRADFFSSRRTACENFNGACSSKDSLLYYVNGSGLAERSRPSPDDESELEKASNESNQDGSGTDQVGSEFGGKEDCRLSDSGNESVSVSASISLAHLYVYCLASVDIKHACLFSDSSLIKVLPWQKGNQLSRLHQFNLMIQSMARNWFKNRRMSTGFVDTNTC